MMTAASSMYSISDSEVMPEALSPSLANPALRELQIPDDYPNLPNVPNSFARTIEVPAPQRSVSRAAPLEGVTRQLGRMSTCSAAMRDVFTVAERLSASNVTVTIFGETGTGKDVLAHALHDDGPRSDRPFVVFDCASVPPNLVESELFGHERGSFTGAYAEHAGAFERALGGTLFFDEVGELPMELQPRLLRALDGQAFRRVGGTRDRKIDVRIIAATNRDLGSLVTARHFRQDLYFRLAAATVQLPPLRDRLDDLGLLVPRLLSDLGRAEVRLSEDAWLALRSHRWPGNVRELKNALALALTFLDGGPLEARHLRLTDSDVDHSALDGLPLGGYALADLESAAIGQTLKQTRGNKIQAARLLGIAVSTLYEKLQKKRL
jgi:DNA-binding NtrC family response regulator